MQTMRMCKEECTLVHDAFSLHAPSHRVPLGKDWSLSIVVPFDAIGNREMDRKEGSGFPICIETALFKNDTLTYMAEWGYEDIVRFYGNANGRASDASNIEKVAAEIARLKSLVKNE